MLNIKLNTVELKFNAVRVDYVRKGTTEATSRIEVKLGTAKLGTLWKKGENLDMDGTVYTTYSGDIYITDKKGQYKALKAGDKHPYGTIVEVTNKDGLGTHYEIEGEFSEEVRKVFYKPENGTITIQLVVTVPPVVK